MKERLNFRQLIAVASMLFGLFFGAGNLIFPVHMGQLAGANSYIAALGFIVTAVGLPLIGVAAFGISRSDDLLAMSSRVGKGYGVFFTCALYLTIGPLFAIPRCAATSFTIGVEPMLTGGAVTELAIFSVIFFALVLFFALGLRRGYGAKALVKMAWSKMPKSMIVLRILFFIGLLTGLWRSCGTIAFFIYHGIRVITPSLFILVAFLLTVLLSYALGTSCSWRSRAPAA